jgi:hypothetical protein
MATFKIRVGVQLARFGIILLKEIKVIIEDITQQHVLFVTLFGMLENHQNLKNTLLINANK